MTDWRGWCIQAIRHTVTASVIVSVALIAGILALVSVELYKAQNADITKNGSPLV